MKKLIKCATDAPGGWAPDKIYTCYNIEEGEKRQLWSTVLLSDVEQVGEYIRKDALLEWLRNEYKTISWYYEKMKHVTGCIGDNSSSGKAEAYKKVIDKIESL